MATWWQDERVSDKEILSVPCNHTTRGLSQEYIKANTPATCLGDVDSPCTYTTGKKKGQRMPGFHITRKQDAKRRKHKQRLERERRLLKAQRDNTTRGQRAIAKAMQQFDMIEYQKMREWLRAHGTILINKGEDITEAERRRVVDEGTVIQDEVDAKNYMADVLARQPLEEDK